MKTIDYDLLNTNMQKLSEGKRIPMRSGKTFTLIHTALGSIELGFNVVYLVQQRSETTLIRNLILEYLHQYSLQDLAQGIKPINDRVNVSIGHYRQNSSVISVNIAVIDPTKVYYDSVVLYDEIEDY